MTKTAAVPTPRLLERCHLPLSTLNYWVSSEVIRPTPGKPRGQRYVRWWSPEEAAAVRAIKLLRDTGCPMPVARTVLALVEAGPPEPGQHLLYWDGGTDIRWAKRRSARRRLSTANRRPEVTVYIPISAWLADAADDAEDIDPELLRQQWIDAVNRRPRRMPTVNDD